MSRLHPVTWSVRSRRGVSIHHLVCSAFSTSRLHPSLGLFLSRDESSPSITWSVPLLRRVVSIHHLVCSALLTSRLHPSLGLFLSLDESSPSITWSVPLSRRVVSIHHLVSSSLSRQVVSIHHLVCSALATSRLHPSLSLFCSLDESSPSITWSLPLSR